MRTRMVLCALVLAGCKKAAPPPTGKIVERAADPDRAIAIEDLQHDVAAARAVIAAGRNPAYALDRMQVAARALSDDRDEGVLKLLAEAETIYGLSGPVAYAESKLAAIEKTVAAPVPDGGVAAPPKAEDCAAVRDMLDRVGQKFNGRTDVQGIVARWKAACPKQMRRGSRDRSSSSASSSSSYSSSSGSASANAARQRDDCRRRCDDAAFHCRAGCPSGCTTDKTWEFCNQRNQACRDSCEQNEKFCRAACGE